MDTDDHVLPPLPLRQWVLAVPKRLRYFLHDDAVLQGVAVRILLRACVRRGLLDPHAGDEMGGWAHDGGFSVDASVRIEGADRARRERLLRNCARPPLLGAGWIAADMGAPTGAGKTPSRFSSIGASAATDTTRASQGIGQSTSAKYSAFGGNAQSGAMKPDESRRATGIARNTLR